MDQGETSYAQSHPDRERDLSPPSRSVRERHVRAQYERGAAAAAYAESYDDRSPSARYFQSRLAVVVEALRRSSGGDLLDVGCGPGMLLSRLADERPGDFRMHGIDMSPGMIHTARAKLRGVDGVGLDVATAEDLPFMDAFFRVVMALGVLEYCDSSLALDEISRVAQPGALVLVSMLNPLSPYRIFEWGVFWPVSRLLGVAKRWVRRPFGGWPGMSGSGIRAVPERRLRRMMEDRGLRTEEVVYYDVNLLLPPLDRVLRRWARRWVRRPDTTIARGGPRRRLGTAYLVIASREP